MNKLIRQNHLGRRAAKLVKQWASIGVQASPVAHHRYWLLIDRLRGGHSWPLQWTDDLSGEVRTLASGCDIVTILGWNVEDEPALLVATGPLLRKINSVTNIYVDGFVLINDATSKALLVDIDDEQGIHTNTIDLPAPSPNE